MVKPPNFYALCVEIVRDPQQSLELGRVELLRDYLRELSEHQLRNFQPLLLVTLIALLETIKSFRESHQLSVFNTIPIVLSKIRLDETRDKVFFNLYKLLLDSAYNTEASEEIKHSVIKCICALYKCISWDLLPLIYKIENTPKIAPILHYCVNVAKTEKLTKLRISSIECLMVVAQVHNLQNLLDIEHQQMVSETLKYFLPGISGGLIKTCVEIGNGHHTIIVAALQAWTRFVVLLTRDYDSQPDPKGERNSDWYKSQDVKLEMCLKLITGLTAHEKVQVREALLDSCKLLYTYCINTLPETTSRSVEILIALSEDDSAKVAGDSRALLKQISEELERDELKMNDVLEQNFYNAITATPRIFNQLNSSEQIINLNLILGYLSLFERHKLKQVFFTHSNVHRLLTSLIQVTELSNDKISLLEEYSLEDFEFQNDTRTPWKVFKFREKKIQDKVESICHLLAKSEVCDIVVDYLIDVFADTEHRKEATILLNEIFSVIKSDNLNRIKQILQMYLERQHWNLQLSVNERHNSNEVQNNIIQICLQLEGIGKIALSNERDFESFLLKVLYVVLEKAGSGHSLLRAAGLTAITNISLACGYKSITELINNNSDYFTYHVGVKLKHVEHNIGILQVLSVIIKFGSMEVLPSIFDIIENVLTQFCTKYQNNNVIGYLQVFKIFIESLRKWLQINVAVGPMKTRRQLEEEHEAYKISNLQDLGKDFSDEGVMGRTAEDLWKEDMSRSKEDLEQELDPEEDEYKKPEPPLHIKLTISILKNCLNLLPSKNQTCKILTIELLKEGIEILHDWEDELLPIVHLVWSPLVNRFKEYENPLIINLSFQLLVTLSRLSKYFIRSRTIKEVLPALSEVLQKQSKESYLKDIGSVYRYTQSYKMQLTILNNLNRLLYDLDANSHAIEIMAASVNLYLSDKQPKPLQQAAVNFYNDLIYYDKEFAIKVIKQCDLESNLEFKKNYENFKF